MHPYVEILFSLFLAILGTLMIRKLTALKSERKNAGKRSSVQEKHIKLLSKKISFRFMIVLFTLVMIIAITILIEKGIMTVTW